MDDRFEITHGARRTSGRPSRTDVRGAYRHGRGEVRGRRHPYLPRFWGWWLRDPEWEWHAAEERGHRWSSAWLSVRYVLLVAGLIASGLFFWTSAPFLRWVAVVLWGVAVLSVFGA